VSQDLNRTFHTGRLTRDCELKYLPDGTAVANMRLAVNDDWTDKKTGEKKGSTLFIDVAVFGNAAESCKKFLSKGSKILVEGKLSCREYEDKQGNKKQAWSIKADPRGGVQFLDSKQERLDRSEGSEQQEAAETAPARLTPKEEDDLPFVWLLPLIPFVGLGLSMVA
jgi:single-strand DNA-binding protein